MESEENQNQVSLASHSPWKSLSRFPHSHSPDDRYLSQRKEPPRRIASLPLSGSFFNEKMLFALLQFAPQYFADGRFGEGLDEFDDARILVGGHALARP